MNIGINASYMELTRAGVARFIVNLLNIWSVIYPEHKYYLYFKGTIPKDRFLEDNSFIKKLIKCPSLMNRASIWENIYLPKAVSKDKCLDIFFSPSYALPVFLRCKKKVVTIFDISYISHPEWYARSVRWHYNVATFFTVRNADLIITSSNFSKKEIIKYLGVSEEKVKVVYLAADDRFRPLSDDGKIKIIKEKFTAGRDYLFFLGFLIQRRNIETLLKAFKKFFTESQSNYSLLLVGANRTHPYIDLNKLIISLGLEKDVFWYPHVKDFYLPTLYNRARLFIYPSCYEGFGIPPLEAMASGIPVITSNLSSLPEVVGDAAYLLKNPNDINEMVEAMKNVSTDEGLRKAMIVKGLRQAKLFSWQKCAQIIMETINKIVYF